MPEKGFTTGRLGRSGLDASQQGCLLGRRALKKVKMSWIQNLTISGCWIFAKNSSAGNVPASGWKMFSEQKWVDVKSLSILSV